MFPLNGYKEIARKSGTLVFKKKKEVVKIQEIPEEFDIASHLNQSIESLGQLNSSNINYPFDYKILPDNNEYFKRKSLALKTTFIKGETLDNIHQKRIPTILKEDIVLKILKAFKLIHDRNILHKDVKLENIWIRKNLLGYSIILGDFNLFSSKKSVFAAPEYLAPEVEYEDDYNLKSEIWSIGIVMYFIYNGCFPFLTRNDALEAEVVRRYIKENELNLNNINSLQPEVAKAIRLSLERDPNRRIGSVDEIISIISSN